MASTIKDVAKRAGVGIATVSRVINDSPNVLPETRERVLAVIDELEYRPNQAARQLVTARSNAIAVVVPFFTRPFFIEVLRGIESVIAPSEYQLIIFNVETPQQRRHYFATLPFLGRTDGIIIVSVPVDVSDAQRLQATHVPTVLIDTSSPLLPSLAVDNVAGGKMAVDHLISKGHERIAYVCGSQDAALGFTSNRDRQRGYEQALREADLKINENYIKIGEERRVWGYQATIELLALPTPPTAIFTATDDLAFGVIDAIKESGLTIGKDVAVVGYDDLEVAHYVGLTTIHQPMEGMGKQGAKVLLDGLQTGTLPPTLLHLPVTLIERASSQR